MRGEVDTVFPVSHDGGQVVGECMTVILSYVYYM